jgi:hypothetical protein
VASSALRFAEGSSEECLLCTTDASEGIFLMFHRGVEHGEEFPYEVVVWGPSWLSAAVATLPYSLSRPA